eukprot:PLAT7021.6.p1 GENE.PLAT7021.6~~PLAT7021.6.p1  ORF type:complete len:712 (-),score=152.37 PLAT7021.6:58-2160(-)
MLGDAGRRARRRLPPAAASRPAKPDRLPSASRRRRTPRESGGREPAAVSAAGSRARAARSAKRAPLVAGGTMSLPGLKGLRNLGNTCFLNSVLQNLLPLPAFQAHFLTDSSAHGPEGRLTKAIRQLSKEAWSSKQRVLDPTPVLASLTKRVPRLGRRRQQDSAEAYRLIVNALHGEAKRRDKTRRSLCERNMRGLLHSVVTCSGCAARSVTKEHFYDLSLPIPRKLLSQIKAAHLPASSRQTLARLRKSKREERRAAGLPARRKPAEPRYEAESTSKATSSTRRHRPLSSKSAASARSALKAKSDDYASSVRAASPSIEAEASDRLRLLKRSRSTAGARRPSGPPLVREVASVSLPALGRPSSWPPPAAEDGGHKDKDDDEPAAGGRRDERRTASEEKDGSRGVDKAGKVDSDDDVTTMTHLESCLRAFTRREIVEDYACASCEKRCDASRGYEVARAPPVLVIHMRRFRHVGRRSVKINTPLTFPTTLHLQPYGAAAVYRLQGIIVHGGGMGGGHYAAYVAHQDENGCRVWAYVTDSRLREATEDEVKQRAAYMLFYARCDGGGSDEEEEEDDDGSEAAEEAAEVEKEGREEGKRRRKAAETVEASARTRRAKATAADSTERRRKPSGGDALRPTMRTAGARSIPSISRPSTPPAPSSAARNRVLADAAEARMRRERRSRAEERSAIPSRLPVRRGRFK